MFESIKNSTQIMKLRLICLLISLMFIFFKSFGLNLPHHSLYSSNHETISAFENSILESLEENPFLADSLARKLLLRYSGKDIYAEAIGNYYQGEAAYYQQNWSDAVTYYKKATDCFATSGDSIRLASAWNNLGLVYYYLGQFDNALHAFTQSLSIELKFDNEKGIAQSYQNMALMFEQAGQVNKALEFYDKALDIFLDLNEWEEAAGTYNNLAAIFAAQNEFQKAESHYLKALDIYSKRNLPMKEATVLCNIGALMMRQRNFDEAGNILERALVLMKAAGDKTGEVSAYILLGDLYAAKNEHQQAIFLYKKAHELAIQVESADLILTNLYSLYLGYKNAGLFEDALKTHEQYQALRDSFLKENPVYKQGILNQELERQLAQRELQNYKAQIRERIYWAVLILTVVLATIITVYLLIRRNRAVKQVHQQAFGQKFIQSQMDTHFVFSMLSSLQGHIISGNNELALDHLSNVAALLRKIFENTGKGLIPLSQEIDFLHAYFLVQQQRFSKDIGFNIESNLQTDEGTILVPFMVTKPFIENAITNGLLNEQENPCFNIAFMRRGDKLEVTIEDNGSSGLNIKNRQLEERLRGTGIPIAGHKVLSKLQPSQEYVISGVKVEDKSQVGMGQGTRIRFCFPIVTSN